SQILAAANGFAVRSDPGDVVWIVKRHVRDGNPAYEHRSKAANGRQRAGASNLNIDVFQDGLGLLRSELVRNRPARTARHEAKALLQRQRVDLVNNAVDFIGQ